MRLFLDDDTVHRRPPPPDWVHVTTAACAIELIETQTVVALSLDHDLGEGQPTGYEAVKHLEYRLRADIRHFTKRDWSEHRPTWRAD